MATRPLRTTGSGHLGEPTTILGAKLRSLRIDAGLTQAQMAAALGTGGNRVSDWELGFNTPTLRTLQYYATVLDTTVADILGGVM